MYIYNKQIIIFSGLVVGMILFLTLIGNTWVRASNVNESVPPDEDGYDLWLRYHEIADPELLNKYREKITEIVVKGDTQIYNSVGEELDRGLSGLLDKEIPVLEELTRDGAVVVGSPDESSLIDNLGWNDEFEELGPESFIIRTTKLEDKEVIVIVGGSDRGALYGIFRFLSLLQRYEGIENLDIVDKPVNELRVLNHWDNWHSTHFGTIERGYSGETLWNWSELPDEVDSRYEDYARANASIGINGSVINNVNAQVDFIKSENLPKVAALADVFREYGITLYLSIRYDSPIELGDLDKADPKDPAVIEWWQEKVEEIYSYIPDFGGFLVKGDSEGQPGPLEYDRDHAVGANMLADVLRPYDGIVMWRTFVYGIEGLSSDRVKQNYQVFSPLDGDFADNVILQPKNGPLDFQVREPVNPVIGGLSETNTGIELQITQEYTGTNVHLCYLVPQWKEIFEFNTKAKETGSSVKKIIDGSLFNNDLSLVAGVANTGSDRNWTNHHLAQSNWHGFGRLAWDPDLSTEKIADEWVRMTFNNQEKVVKTIKSMLLKSWEIYESYTSPLGLGFMVEMGTDRLRPSPAKRQNYHKANSTGVGYDRTRSGSGYVDQYYPEVADMYNNIETTPEELLLWFHHVPYTYELQSGMTLIQEIYYSYFSGVEKVKNMIEQWKSLEGLIDDNRYKQVLSEGLPVDDDRAEGHFPGSLKEQLEWAKRWRDRCTEYFYNMSGISFGDIKIKAVPNREGKVISEGEFLEDKKVTIIIDKADNDLFTVYWEYKIEEAISYKKYLIDNALHKASKQFEKGKYRDYSIYTDPFFKKINAGEWEQIEYENEEEIVKKLLYKISLTGPRLRSLEDVEKDFINTLFYKKHLSDEFKEKLNFRYDEEAFIKVMDNDEKVTKQELQSYYTGDNGWRYKTEMELESGKKYEFLIETPEGSTNFEAKTPE